MVVTSPIQETDFLDQFENIFKIRESIYINTIPYFKMVDESEVTEKLSLFLELTKLDLGEYRHIVGENQYTNHVQVFLMVNTNIAILLDKNQVACRQLFREKFELFHNMNSDKVNRMFDFFSEILCITPLVHGDSNFVISADNKEFLHRKNGRFDLAYKKNGQIYFFDVKRISADEPFDFDEKRFENKVKDHIDNLLEKQGQRRPLFLVLDVSDLLVVEKYIGTTMVGGQTVPMFSMNYVDPTRMRSIIEKYFANNRSTHPNIDQVVGVLFFGFFRGFRKGKNIPVNVMRYSAFLNDDSMYRSELPVIGELSGILINKLNEEVVGTSHVKYEIGRFLPK